MRFLHVVSALYRVCCGIACILIALGALAFVFVPDTTQGAWRLAGIPVAIFFIFGARTILTDAEDKFTGRQPAPAVDAPAWFFPAGIILVLISLLAFGFGAAKGGSSARLGDPPGAALMYGLLDGGLNPLFFIGFPLGAYWIYRGSRRTNASHESAGTGVIESANPRLTHCEDCGGHVSRLAKSCPHCGRPMSESVEDKVKS